MKYPTSSQLKTKLEDLINNKDYKRIHTFLCHPHTNQCSDFCRREVKKDRLQIYRDICKERK